MKKPGSGKKSQSFPVPIGKELFRTSYSQIHAVFRMFQEFFIIPILSQISDVDGEQKTGLVRVQLFVMRSGSGIKMLEILPSGF